MTYADDPVHPTADAPSGGLSVREYFACHAMTGILANCKNLDEFRKAAERAVQKADELILQLNGE